MDKKEEKKGIPVTIDLPKPFLQPILQRIYVKEYVMDDVKTKSGIYIPTDFTKIKGEQTQQWKFRRYFVLAVARDVDIMVDDPELKEPRKLRRGDEIAIFYHEDALKYEPAQVNDFIAQEKWIVLHQTEVAGVYPHKIVEDDA